MIIKKTTRVYLFLFILLMSPVAFAQNMENMDKGMMDGKPMDMKMGQDHMQKMHQMMGEMMGMMKEIMETMKGTAQDPATQHKMDKMMKNMNEMMKQQAMMNGGGMMEKSPPK